MPIHISNDTLWNLLQAEENDQLEFKSSSLLIEPDQDSRRKIAREIVAFANNKGGKIVFGVGDDGDIEGADLSEEMCLGTISEIIEDYCSPTPKIEHNFYSESNGDLSSGSVLVLQILEQVAQPPVAVVDYSEGRIKRREYRIRSGESTRYVSDGELTGLFNDSPDERLENQYTVVYTTTDDLEQVSLENKPNYFRDIGDTLSEISENCDSLKDLFKREEEGSDEELIDINHHELFVKIVTISVLRDFYERPAQMNDGRLSEDSDENRYESLNLVNQGIDEVEYDELETDDKLLSNIETSLADLIDLRDVKTIIEDYETGFQVPEGSTIRINDRLDGFQISAPEMFDISVDVMPNRGSVGLPYEHPRSSIKGTTGLRNYEDADDSFWTTQGTMEVSIDFEYPVQSYSNYDDSREYFDEYFEPLVGKYNWEDFVSELPDKKLQMIEKKIDQIKNSIDPQE